MTQFPHFALPQDAGDPMSMPTTRISKTPVSVSVTSHTDTSLVSHPRRERPVRCVGCRVSRVHGHGTLGRREPGRRLATVVRLFSFAYRISAIEYRMVFSVPTSYVVESEGCVDRRHASRGHSSQGTSNFLVPTRRAALTVDVLRESRRTTPQLHCRWNGRTDYTVRSSVGFLMQRAQS